jgi:hypothetical protein
VFSDAGAANSAAQHAPRDPTSCTRTGCASGSAGSVSASPSARSFAARAPVLSLRSATLRSPSVAAAGSANDWLRPLRFQHAFARLPGAPQRPPAGAAALATSAPLPS